MKKILLIEDDQDVLENTATILEFANYKVATAENGKIGISKAKTFKPDIIISDIMMPEMDGYAVLETLNQDPDTAGIPFIFLTAKSERKDMRTAMSLGADDYLIKPFDEQELLDALDIRLRKNEFLKQKFSKNIGDINTFFKKASEYFGMELLARNHKIKKFEAGAEVFREADPAHSLYFIQKGNVKTFKMTESGKELITGMHKKGDFLGQTSLLNRSGTYLETATVLEDTEALCIPKKDFITLVYGNKVVSNKFLNLISNDLIHVQEQLIDMAFSSVKRRAAKALLELHEKGLMEDSEHQGVDIPREDFAAMIGTATETAIRTLSEFKQLGCVGLGTKKRLILLDLNSLRQIAEFG